MKKRYIAGLGVAGLIAVSGIVTAIDPGEGEPKPRVTSSAAELVDETPSSPLAPSPEESTPDETWTPTHEPEPVAPAPARTPSEEPADVGCELTSPAGNCYADGQFCAGRHHGLGTHGLAGEWLTCSQDSSGRWRWSDGVTG